MALSRVGVEIFLSAVYGRYSEKYNPDLDSTDANIMEIGLFVTAVIEQPLHASLCSFQRSSEG